MPLSLQQELEVARCIVKKRALDSANDLLLAWHKSHPDTPVRACDADPEVASRLEKIKLEANLDMLARETAIKIRWSKAYSRENLRTSTPRKTAGVKLPASSLRVRIQCVCAPSIFPLILPRCTSVAQGPSPRSSPPSASASDRGTSSFASQDTMGSSPSPILSENVVKLGNPYEAMPVTDDESDDTVEHVEQNDCEYSPTDVDARSPRLPYLALEQPTTTTTTAESTLVAPDHDHDRGKHPRRPHLIPHFPRKPLSPNPHTAPPTSHPYPTNQHGNWSFLYLMRNMMPHAPRAPGMPGLVFHYGSMPPLLPSREELFVTTEMRTGYRGKGPLEYTYLGTYQVVKLAEEDGKLSKEEWAMLPCICRSSWSRKLSRQRNEDVRSIREKAFMSETGVPDSVEGDSMEDSNPGGRDVQRLFDQGEEQLSVFGLRCIGYNFYLEGRLGQKLKEFATESARDKSDGPLGPRKRKRVYRDVDEDDSW
ncbi:hypothetical protein OF83DRAFT_1173170 [Amylostereum chailletii]|nr:hypothetical protein OF83DRAFT_1173170 [Amylostereum chailletii]